MPAASPMEFFIDPSRCIGCNACVQACSECDTHKGYSMIQLDYIDRATSTQTAPVVCMHCDSPTCAEVCPADAIKRTSDGVVQSARKPRCIACNNCVLACPFGVPKMNTQMNLMMKCDMCYDRTSAGKKPMCASVCPESGAVLRHTRRDRGAPPALAANQHVPIRRTDHYHQSQYDGAALRDHRADRCHGDAASARGLASRPPMICCCRPCIAEPLPVF